MVCLSDFRVGKLLGAGSFGEVHFARDAAGVDVVLKSMVIVGVSRKEQEAALNEVRLLAQLDHPRIVRYHASFVEGERLRIVMQFCECGDLRKHIEAQQDIAPFSAEVAWRFIAQAAQGLAHLHAHKILHRDLKSSNLFLTRKAVGGDSPPDLVIGDLGCSRLLGATSDLAATMIGTPYYLSPELCNNELYDAKSDVWALGVVCYELLTCGEYPYTANNSAALIMRILRDEEEVEEASLEEEALDATLREEVEAFDISLDGPMDGDEAADDSDLGLELYEDDYLEVDAVEERPSTASVGWRIVGEAS